MTTDISLSHVTLPITDLDQAEAFYVGVLGLRLSRKFDRAAFLRHRPDRAKDADAANSPLHIALAFGDPEPELQLFLQPRGADPLRPHPHVAFTVTPARLLELHRDLHSRGVPCDGPRRLGPPGHGSLYFVDPFGNHLELTAMGFSDAFPVGPPDLDALGRAHAARRSESGGGG